MAAYARKTGRVCRQHVGASDGVAIQYRCTRVKPAAVYQVVLTSAAAAHLGRITRETVRDAMLGSVCVYHCPGLGLGGRRVSTADLEAEFNSPLNGMFDHDFVFHFAVEDAVLRIITAAVETRKGVVRLAPSGHGHTLTVAEKATGVAVSPPPSSPCVVLCDDSLANVLGSITDVRTLASCAAVCRRWRSVMRWALQTIHMDQLRLYRVPRRRVVTGLLKAQTQRAATTNVCGAMQWIGNHLPRLEALSITDLNGLSATSLLPICRGCPQLHTMRLNQERFEPNSRQWVSTGVAAIKQRQCLFAIPAEISMLTHLVHIDLACHAIRRLPQHLDLPVLETLDVYGNHLGIDGGAAEFAIEGCPNLKTLNVGSNKWHEFPGSILALTSLVDLNIEGVDCGANNVIVPADIARLDSLFKLNLEESDVVDLPAALPHRLEILWLRMCYYLQGASFGVLPTLTSLRELCLCGVDDLGENPDGLAAICQCIALEELQLCCCAIRHIPPEFSQLCRLAWLSLGWNTLATFPEPLRFLTALGSLDLRGQGVKFVPVWATEMTSLTECFVWREGGCVVPREVTTIMPGVFCLDGDG